MKVTLKTPTSQIEAMLLKSIEKRKIAAAKMLCFVGLKCVNASRNVRSYMDRTGNLRSSIGFMVLMDGKVIKSGGFNSVKGGTEGTLEGKALANKLASQSKSGIVLIVVAGMNYARYVTSKGYDVLDSGEMLAKRLVPKMMRQLSKK